MEIPSPPASVDEVVSRYENAVTRKTRAVMFTHIPYVTGLLIPPKEISQMARWKRLLTSVHGAHPLGMLDLDSTGWAADRLVESVPQVAKSWADSVATATA